LWLLFEQARIAGAVVRDHERVLDVQPDGDGVTVHSAHRTYRAGHVVIATGAYANPLLEPLGIKLDIEVFEMTTASFRLRDPDTDLPTWFAFQKPTEEDINLFYGFGRNPWSGSDLVRAAPDFEDAVVEDPYEASHTPRDRHVTRVADWVRAHLPVLDPEPRHARTGLAALPKDPGRQFYFGPAPSHVANGERLTIFSAGWGFKFVPLLGRACAELAIDGRSSFDLSRFALT
jgi:glycine/D-amino acid oxidase-like deaminating enzyme